jgi:hypothetical protein
MRDLAVPDVAIWLPSVISGVGALASGLVGVLVGALQTRRHDRAKDRREHDRKTAEGFVDVLDGLDALGSRPEDKPQRREWDANRKRLWRRMQHLRSLFTSERLRRRLEPIGDLELVFCLAVASRTNIDEVHQRRDLVEDMRAVVASHLRGDRRLPRPQGSAEFTYTAIEAFAEWNSEQLQLRGLSPARRLGKRDRDRMRASMRQEIDRQYEEADREQTENDHPPREPG